MDAWMDGWMDEWIGGRVDKWKLASMYIGPFYEQTVDQPVSQSVSQSVSETNGVLCTQIIMHMNM